jgi:ABC-2 type transport system ATP-binding protein
MIKTDSLAKHFPGARREPGVTAVAGLSLDVPAGAVFGFLGPNGAGKTTTVRMLTGLIAPTGGRAWVNGFEIGREDMAVRRSVGVLTETPGLYERMSAERNLALFARLYEVPDVAGQVAKYLRLLGLWERRKEPVGGFSKGMKQKLAIARALVHEPKTLFLDEPTSGLDPEAAKTVRDFVMELRSEGRTIFLCTHNLDEADRLCDRVAVFKTRLIQVGTPDDLRRSLPGAGRTVVVHLRNPGDGLAEAARQLPFVQEARLINGKLAVTLADPEADNPALVRCLVEAGGEVQFVGELRHSLEDVYLDLIHRQG